MANKIKTIPSKARELLEAITEKYGIETIENYIKLYRHRNRKLMKHHNTKEDVAYDVFKLVFDEKYSITKSKNEISNKRNISISTINNHINNFNKEARENNFYTLGYIVNEIYNYCNFDMNYNPNYHIELLAKENNLDEEILNTYYWKYKTLPKIQKDKFSINIESVKIPNEIKDILSERFFLNDDIPF